MQSAINNILSKIIKEAINKPPLYEAYNNLTKKEFDSAMAKMGFVVRNGAGSRFIYTQPQYHTQITVHWHGGNIKASTLTHVRNELKNAGWFNDPKNLKLFPFQKWGFKPNQVVQQNPNLINSPYENDEGYPINQNGMPKKTIIENKLNNMQKIRLTESQLQNIIKEAINEISASLANRAASKAYQRAREGYGQYPNGEIPFDSPHGKKFQQGEKFLKYRNHKLGIDKGNMIYYPNGDGSAIQLKDKNLNPLTEPTDSFEDMEAQYNNSMRESISRIVKKSINEMYNRN